MRCKKCGSTHVTKAGLRSDGTGRYQMHICAECGHRFKGEKLA